MTAAPLLQLSEVCSSIQDLFDAKACLCAVVGDEDVEFVAGSGADAAHWMGRRLRVGEGITGYVAQSGVAVEIADVVSDDRFAKHLHVQGHYLPQALIGAPLLHDDGRVVGVLQVLDPASDVAAEAHAVAGGVLPVLALVAAEIAPLLTSF
jgi:GAF domain-containing protein